MRPTGTHSWGLQPGPLWTFLALLTSAQPSHRPIVQATGVFCLSSALPHLERKFSDTQSSTWHVTGTHRGFVGENGGVFPMSVISLYF